MNITDYLTWTSIDDADYETRFERRAEARLTHAIAAVRALPTDNEDLIGKILADLPSEAVLRLMHAPELEYRLRGAAASTSGQAALAQFLYQRMRVELLPDGGGEPARIGPGIPVDFDSSCNRGDLPNRFPQSANHPSSDQRVVLEKLTRAFALIEAGGEPVARFVTSFTHVIVPIHVESSGRWFGSFSSSWYPGRSVLVNADVSDMLAYDIAAALVHEAIHSLVDVSELEGRLLAPGRTNDRTAQSPWTGAVISVQSLVDAYFVWYGLLNFWRAVSRAQPGVSVVCDRYAALCRQGFVPPLNAVLDRDGLDTVHEFARERIEAARDRVNVACV